MTRIRISPPPAGCPPALVKRRDDPIDETAFPFLVYELCNNNRSFNAVS
jgi:hypothetical protein